MPSCSFLVTALTFLQAGVVENMKKLIYHSQPEVTEASHSMLEGTEIAAFHKALGLSVVSLCSEYSLPSWCFCQQLRYIALHRQSPRSDNWNQLNELFLPSCYWPEALGKLQRQKLVPGVGPQPGCPVGWGALKCLCEALSRTPQ